MSGGDLRERVARAICRGGSFDPDHASRDARVDYLSMADAVLAELGLTEDPAEMRRVGDLLQSDASRMAEWVLAECERAPNDADYEVCSAAISAQSAVEKWTALRLGVGS